MDILSNEFDIDELTDWGFKHIDLDINIYKITEGNTEDDHIPEVKESRVKLGDVWQLGKHRLMCGDSTKESDVKKLMNGEKAELLHADPPYGMGGLDELIDKIASKSGLIVDGGVVVAGHSKHGTLKGKYGFLNLTSHRQYGDNVVDFFVCTQNPREEPIQSTDIGKDRYKSW